MKTNSHPAASKPDRGIPQEWRWHFRALGMLRDHLLDDLRLRLGAAAEPTGPHSMDPADSATDESDRILAVSLLSGEHDALHEVDSALRRIRNGTYGICERSGEHIPAARLRAVPWTRFTREAAEALEKGGAIRVVKLAPLASIQDAETDTLAHAEDPGKEELQARVVGRHQRAEAIEELAHGGRAEGEPETEPGENRRDHSASVQSRNLRKPEPRAGAAKIERAGDRRAGRRSGPRLQ